MIDHHTTAIGTLTENDLTFDMVHLTLILFRPVANDSLARQTLPEEQALRSQEI